MSNNLRFARRYWLRTLDGRIFRMEQSLPYHIPQRGRARGSRDSRPAVSCRLPSLGQPITDFFLIRPVVVGFGVVIRELFPVRRLSAHVINGCMNSYTVHPASKHCPSRYWSRRVNIFRKESCIASSASGTLPTIRRQATYSRCANCL